MMNAEFRESATEVLDILDHTRIEDVKKISPKFLDFLREQSDSNYVSTLDYSNGLDKMSLKPKTCAILGLIYLKFWADEEGKKKFIVKLRDNEEKYQKELSKKYSVDNLFKKRREATVEEITELPADIKEKTFLQKIINKIKNLFGGRKHGKEI